MYQIEQALGHYVIIEPFEKSTVLQADETATVFKVVSIGIRSDNVVAHEPILSPFGLNPGDLIIVEKNSVLKTVMGGQDVWYIADHNIVARLKHD